MIWDSIGTWIGEHKEVATSTAFAAVIGGTFALVVGFMNAVSQFWIASTKLKRDRSGELIDEFFDDAIYEARLKIDFQLKLSSESNIDRFRASLSDENKKCLSRLMHYFEKLEGLVASKYANRRLLRNTLSNKVSWWLVHLIERFENSTESEWYPLLFKLRRLRHICSPEDHRRYRKQVSEYDWFSL